MRLDCVLALCLPLLSGCVMVEVGVTNPVAGLTTVAVVPFFNLSQEKAVDGRRFAMAYYTELQKTPGFQVLPVGVVEQVMYDQQLEMSNPDDVLRLAKLLNVDAVVVGAVTDYSPYYPPRIGMQVSWYSPRPWEFYPGMPIDEQARDLVKPPSRFNWFRKKTPSVEECPPEAVVVRGQTAEGEAPGRSRSVSLPEFLLFGEDGTPLQEEPPTAVTQVPEPRELDSPVELPAPSSSAVEELLPRTPPGQPTYQTTLPFDPRQPLMSYTRMFDGADAKLTARLRDYVELSGDLRSGGWEAYLSRSEDFIRFTSHVMIVEMLQLHGGEARKRIVLKFRKYR